MLVAAALALGAPSASAAVIDSAAAVQRGAIVELHFGLRGNGLSWTLSAHGDELWIDLANTRIELPSRRSGRIPVARHVVSGFSDAIAERRYFLTPAGD